MPQIDGPVDQLYTSNFKTNFGWMRSVSNGDNLIRLDWNQSGWHNKELPDNVSRETKSQILAFFSGQLMDFTLPLAPINKSVAGRFWLNILERIPYGVIITYGQFAAFSGKPNAARAAASVCANNPIPIIYPCHRVVPAYGAPGSYGGGSGYSPDHKSNLARKTALLQHEAHHANAIFS